MMRAWLAGLFVMGGVFLAVAFLGLEHVSFFLAIPAIIILFFILFFLALVLFNSEFKKPRTSAEKEQEDREWEQQLIATDYHATRAFEVEDDPEEYDEDVGPYLCFFLELHDGSVLYLTGTYIERAQYEEESDAENPPFPCTLFTIKRHREEGWATALLCKGQPLEFETLPLTFWNSWLGPIPNDGDVFTDRTLDQLKNGG